MSEVPLYCPWHGDSPWSYLLPLEPFYFPRTNFLEDENDLARSVPAIIGMPPELAHASPPALGLVLYVAIAVESSAVVPHDSDQLEGDEQGALDSAARMRVANDRFMNILTLI
eukprot:CAMPEP_0180135682 /NCGR_PEP_ID=MMETSP0986-20121125/10991_1 /TAXON_ID=697907 /ORGANISM="non described non described, Strain CCMP2293" /LENGTH=112 /DNA_ID=CAMNT_0022076457 /DNA_START=193 /DNA_END=528 /DNA_ORIENTATION=-